LARRREDALAGGIPAGPARRRLAELESAVGAAIAADIRQRTVSPGRGRALIAAASGVPLGVLRQLAAGIPTVRREHEARLLATTAAVCLSHRVERGSRGRPGQSGAERIDAGPTWQIIRDLRGRGLSLGWIGRELGYASALQIGPERISRRLADRIQQLADRLGDLRITGPQNRIPPPLADLLAAQEVA
jgi:hypothetical protein